MLSNKLIFIKIQIKVFKLYKLNSLKHECRTKQISIYNIDNNKNIVLLKSMIEMMNLETKQCLKLQLMLE